MVSAARKNIPFDRMLSRSYWMWRANPALSVPTMLSTSLPILSQAVFGIFGLALLIRLEETNWLTQIVNDINGAQYGSLAALVLSQPFLSILLDYMLPAAATVIVVVALAGGFIYSAEFGAYWRALGGSHVGISEVMDNFVDRWKPMAWASFLSGLLTIIPLVAGFLFLLAVLALGAPPLLFVLASLAVVAGFVLTIIFSLFLIYTPVVVISDNVSGLAAIRRSWQQVNRNRGISATYGVVYILLTVAVTSVSSLVPLANLPLSSLASVGILILVTPVLHLTKTAIYSELQKVEPVEFNVYRSFLMDIAPLLMFLWRTFVQGLKELKSFALNAANTVYHAISASAVVIGFFLGSWVASNGLTQVIYGLGYSPGKINPLASSSVPLALGVYIFFHNWQVSLAAALSGTWFSLAPFTTLLLNGVILGVVSSLVPNRVMLLAALVPHGIIEVPSFVLAGSAGIKLGVKFFKFTRKHDQESTAEFHSVARETVYIVVGLALLFFIAGLIEANLTPAIMRMAGWT